ncbi:hypothetical protein I7I50_05285 [Histoplasma capsulatum G186AR]|uniref:Uncharacterized protein n=1 Tax=Ajellomyces capsulatus TaxID=5037 RepID=A0A8H7Z6S4_AJECA|nr:hypothetical protein I7I52_03544 [Histoplasma capsulatum]QSS75976.1 hypothetical protein I7I50_05285 [Histoplasma capsulatum G186AR]
MQSVFCMPQSPAKEEDYVVFAKMILRPGTEAPGRSHQRKINSLGERELHKTECSSVCFKCFSFRLSFIPSLQKRKKKKNNAQRPTHRIYNAGPRLHQNCSIRSIPPFHQEKPSGLCLCALRMQTRWGQLQVQSTCTCPCRFVDLDKNKVKFS